MIFAREYRIRDGSALLDRTPTRLAAACILGAALGLLACARPPGAAPQDLAAALREKYQPPLADLDAACIADGPSLHDAIRIAAERSPAAQAARLRWLAAIEREPQAATPPDPMLDFGYPLRESEMEIAPMLWRIGLSQPIPWWRKLWAAQRMAALEADMARLAYETALLETIAQTKESYYELYYLDRAIPIAAKAEEIFRNQATLAYGELSAGRSELNEAFRAESQAAQLEYDRLLLGEQRFAQAEGFKALLNLPSGARVGPIRSAPAYPVSPSFEELAARAERYARELQSMGLDARRAAYESYLARLARIPDLTLGLDLAKMGEMTPGFMDMFESKGKNPIEGAIRLELPIWEWRNRALEREKEALREAMEREAMGETNRLRAAVAAAWYRVRLAERLVALYENTLLPQADAAMRQAEAQYRAQLASLATVLESTLAWQNFQLALERARADRGQALVALERAIGTTAEARPAEEARP